MKISNGSSKMIILSIQPRYAKKIFNNTKCVELRRVRPQISKGDIVVVYVSSPIKQVWGTFTVEGIIEKSLEKLWIDVRNDAGVTKEEFDLYFTGLEHGFGIYMQEVKNMEKPIGLDDIKKNWSTFHPPQSYRYLTEDELSMITNSR